MDISSGICGYCPILFCLFFIFADFVAAVVSKNETVALGNSVSLACAVSTIYQTVWAVKRNVVPPKILSLSGQIFDNKTMELKIASISDSSSFSYNLIILNATLDMEGDYDCAEGGMTKSSVLLSVEVPPIVTLKIDNGSHVINNGSINVRLNQEIVIQCVAEGGRPLVSLGLEINGNPEVHGIAVNETRNAVISTLYYRPREGDTVISCTTSGQTAIPDIRRQTSLNIVYVYDATTVLPKQLSSLYTIGIPICSVGVLLACLLVFTCIFLWRKVKSVVTHQRLALEGKSISIEWLLDVGYQIKTAILDKDGTELLRLQESGPISAGRYFINGTYKKDMRSSLTFRIINVSFSDTGHYSCYVYSDNDIPIGFQSLLYVQGYPVLNSSTSIEGEMSTAECCVDSSEGTVDDVTWLLQDGHRTIDFAFLNTHRFATHISDNKTEHCESVRFQSDRRYHQKPLTCWISNVLNLSASVVLDVLYPVKLKLFLDDSEMNDTIPFQEHTNITLVCEADSNSVTNITLIRYLAGDSRIHEILTHKPSSEAVSSSKTEWYFYFSNVTKNVTGVYACEAQDAFGTSNSSKVFLDITYGPTVSLITRENVSFTVGGNVSILCRSTSNPVPEIKIQKRIHDLWVNLSITPTVVSSKEHYVTTWQFTLTQMEMDHVGSYRCLVGNQIGDPAWSAVVTLYTSSAYGHTANIIMKLSMCVAVTVMIIGIPMSVSYYLNRKGGRRKELPEIPVDEDNSQNSHHSEGNEPNYYSDAADAIAENHAQMLSEKDISITMNIKMGKIYQRWMGSVNLSEETNKYVVITTLTEKLIRKKEIHWEAFIRKCLKLPTSNHLAKIEAMSVQSSKLFLISEHLNCENLQSVLSRDKDKGDYDCCSSFSVSDVIKHVAGILEGMDVLNTFGFLHPGLTTKKVLLTKEGQVKLFDFCLAGDAPKIAALKKAQVPTVTLNQFPPEMLLLNQYTESSDVWSTAVVIWEIMAAGNPPFPVNKEVTSVDGEATTPSAPWPEKFLQIKDKILFDCWNHNSSLRPSIHHLRGTFVAIFEKLITDSSYEIPIPTTYLPMRAPDTAQPSYAEHIYHAGM
ncbi:uncharacterized protein [Apostichopus japonicus]|uniref:uncharacterized protein isoform X1 n=1 Tax=Stichopus japonicus TaxID=307972 RepID=UPI003AB89FB4